MAASGGGIAPSPPKRPTIIRASPDGGPPVPSRPAPPVPGGVRSPPAIPSRTNVAETEDMPSKPQPPPPSRPSNPVRPPVQPPAKPQPPPPSRPPDVAKGRSSITKPPEKSNNAAVRKRPEITIVSAQPMSEIDFRGAKPSASPTNVIKEEIQSALEHPSPKEVQISTAAPAHPPAPAPRASPRGEKPDKPHTSPRGAPPPVPRHSVIRNDDDKDESSVINDPNLEEVKTVLSRGPPPPVPRPTIIKPSVPPSVSSGRPPPSLPGRPPVSPKVPRQEITEHSAEQNLDTPDSDHDSPPMPHGAPPPVPKHPSLRNKLPSPLVPRKINDLLEKDTNEDNQTLTIGSNIDTTDANTKTNVNASDLYAVINKPKRPTIIRPGRPSGQVTTDLQAENDLSHSNEIKPKVSPTQRLSRNIEKESEAVKVIDSSEHGNEKHAENTNDGNPVPEFLRKKLKSTVNQDNKQDTEESGPTAGGGPKVPLKPRPLSTRGPTPATKPKPSVLPKPPIGAKPAVKTTETMSQSTVKTTETVSPELSNEAETVTENKDNENPSNLLKNVEHKNVSSYNSQLVKHAKRPTIIRPNRSVKTGSAENVNQEIKAEKFETDKMKPFSDDSAIESKPRLQPPLPNKRPVSMINIHKAVEDEEQNISENLESSSSRSSENVNESLRPKPRPAARSRPMTMIVPPVSRPPLPSEGPKLDKSSLPPRPPGRSPVKPPPPDVSNLDKNHDTEISESGGEKQRSQVPFGVSVLPKPEIEKQGPPKPVRRPAQKSSDSSDEEEFVTAKDRPDRPSAPPARKMSGSAGSKDSGGDDTKKPARTEPISPQQDDNDEDMVKKRPPKPEGRPQRPMSMPVKQSPPQKSPPQKPGGPSPSKKNLPRLPGRPKPGHPLYHHMMQVPHGIAVHDYTAQHDDELSFKTGELVILVKRVDTEWILGKVDEREGMFPQDFVKVKMPFPGEKIDDDNSSNDSAEMFYDASPEKPDTIGHGPRCRARFDFDGEGPDDLVFEEGDVIKLIEKVGLEWRKGEINGHVGLFPLSFVEIIEELPEMEEKKDAGSYAKAVFDFEGEEGDLNFQAGETIKITHMVNEEWLYGEIGVRKGQFPVQFVDNVPHGLSPLSSHDMEAKGDNFTETKAEDKLSASLSMRDDHEDRNKQNEVMATSTSNTHAENSPGSVSMVTSESATPYCIALYDYPAQSLEDLEFNEGDSIEIVERISADWLKGKIGGKTGMFPSAFVEIKVDMVETCHSVSEPVHEEVTEVKEVYGIALYDFAGEADNELTFHTGDKFVVQDLVEGAEDWRWGVIDGHRGMFPASFVES